MELDQKLDLEADKKQKTLRDKSWEKQINNREALYRREQLGL